MDLLDKIEKTEMIGKDFLLWLWFKSETQRDAFHIDPDLQAEILIDGKITLETEETNDSVSCSGLNSLMREARLALMENKKITKMALRLNLNEEDEFTFMLDSRWMNYRLFKTPRVIQDLKDDPEGSFYEKAGLIEKAITVMDSVFMNFIRLRISPEWESDELPALMEWIRGANKPLKT